MAADQRLFRQHKAARRKRHIACDELFIKAHRSLILLLLAFRPANASLVYRTRKWGAAQKYPNGSRLTIKRGHPFPAS